MSRADEITAIEGFEVACKLPEPVGNAIRTFDRRTALIVKITTRGGAIGWGEAWMYPASVGAFIRASLAPLVLGMDVTAPRAAQAKMRDLLTPDRRGQGHIAMSALDIAIWDAFGRIAGQPIAALLGGRLRERMPAYASGPLMRQGPDRYAGIEAVIEGYIAAGFRGVKLRIGTTHAGDVAVIRKARALLGADNLLMADLNEGGNPRQAIELAEAVVDQRLAWLEEPLSYDDLPGYRRLAERIPVALAGGESLCGVQSFRDFLSAGVFDVVQPDLAICGGFSEAQRIAGLADAFEVPVALHVWGTGINFLASLQFAATLTPRRGSIPFPLFEIDMGFNPLRTKLCDLGPAADGMIDVPDGPGLGMTIDMDALSDFVTGHWRVDV
jgi:D-galactarolactone cycloisomerase